MVLPLIVAVSQPALSLTVAWASVPVPPLLRVMVFGAGSGRPIWPVKASPAGETAMTGFELAVTSQDTDTVGDPVAPAQVTCTVAVWVVAVRAVLFGLSVTVYPAPLAVTE